MFAGGETCDGDRFGAGDGVACVVVGACASSACVDVAAQSSIVAILEAEFFVPYALIACMRYKKSPRSYPLSYVLSVNIRVEVAPTLSHPPPHGYDRCIK
jgi:hypothetical protein